MAHSLPTGIQQLVSARQLKVRQVRGGFGGNKYELITLDNQFIAKAKEEGGLGALLGGSSRSFNMDIVDQDNIALFSLRRPCTYGPDKMEVSMNGAVVCIIRQQPTMMKSVLHINDAADAMVLRLKSGVNKCEFQLQTSSKNPIGGISKKYGGLMKEMFTYHDTYFVTFPEDLDVRYKAAVIGSCVLVDYLHHEK